MVSISGVVKPLVSSKFLEIVDQNSQRVENYAFNYTYGAYLAFFSPALRRHSVWNIVFNRSIRDRKDYIRGRLFWPLKVNIPSRRLPLSRYVRWAHTEVCRSHWPRSLRYELSSLARTLGSGVRIPFKTWMCVWFILCLCCSVCRWRSCDGLIPVQGVLPIVYKVKKLK
jgi:hypothetical protein